MSRWFAFPALLLAAALAFALWWANGRPQELAAAPEGRLGCVSYTPHHHGQSPFDPTAVIPAARIEADLRLLAERFACVRTYATAQGADQIPRLARPFGLKVLLGAWLGRDLRHNDREIAAAVAAANAHPDVVGAIVVGNEVLLRGELSAEALAGYLRRVRAATRVPVTYADVWEFWLRHPAVAEAADFVTIHILPYWEDDPVAVENAIAHVRAVLARVRSGFPDKRVFIGETGWPSAGRMREGARPGRVNQTRFIRDFLSFARTEGLDYTLFEAFDQPWKRIFEGTVGGHWGLYTAGQAVKVAAAGPVSDDPDWLFHFTLATVLAALAVVALVVGGRRLPRSGWLAFAAAAEVAASAVVLQVNHAVEASRDALEWTVAAAGLGLTLLTVGLLLAALADHLVGRGDGWPPPAPLRKLLAALRRPTAELATRASLLGLARGLAAGAAAAVTLALVFDPRYRDFPVAAFVVPAVGFAAFAWLRPERFGGDDDGLEETWLALLLVAGSLGVAVLEGFENVQALAWSAVTLALAAPWAVAWWRRRPPAAGG